MPGGGEPSTTGVRATRAAVAAERVVALLVGGDEQDLAAHQRAPLHRAGAAARRARRPSPPPMTSAIVARVGVGRVHDEARVVAEVDHVDRAAVLAEQRRRDPVLEPALHGSLTRISSGIGMPAPVVITRVVPSTVARRDAGEPLGQPGRVAHERPHVVGRRSMRISWRIEPSMPRTLPTRQASPSIFVDPWPPSRCITTRIETRRTMPWALSKSPVPTSRSSTTPRRHSMRPRCGRSSPSSRIRTPTSCAATACSRSSD